MTVGVSLTWENTAVSRLRGSHRWCPWTDQPGSRARSVNAQEVNSVVGMYDRGGPGLRLLIAMLNAFETSVEVCDASMDQPTTRRE